MLRVLVPAYPCAAKSPSATVRMCSRRIAAFAARIVDAGDAAGGAFFDR
jgi:hypothetical protein